MLCAVRVDRGFKRVDYDRKAFRQPLRKVGQEVRKQARKLIGRKGVSEPGGMPGKQTGVMQRSIRSKVSRSGYSVSVYPTKTSQMGEVYYPAFVVYGHRGPNSETAREARQHRKRSGVKVAEPRANFIPVAAQRYQQTFQTVITAALDKAIK